MLLLFVQKLERHMASSGNATIQRGCEPQKDDSIPHNNDEASALALANTLNMGSSAELAMPLAWIEQIELLMQASLKEALNEEGIVISKGSTPQSKVVKPHLVTEVNWEKRLLVQKQMAQKLKQAEQDIAQNPAHKDDNPEQVESCFTDYDTDEEEDQAFDPNHEQEPEQVLEQGQGDESPDVVIKKQ